MEYPIKAILLGPLFTQAERIWNRLLKEALEKASEGKLSVVLPQQEAEQFIIGDEINLDAIADSCLANAVTRDLAIAILDGSDADSGTCIEVGYRKGINRNLPVIGVRTDFRSSGEEKGLNAMLRICDEIVYFPSFNEAVSELAETIINVIKRL